MRVWVAYALPHEQFVEQIDVPEGTTAIEAVQMSGLLEAHPEIDMTLNKLGIFAKLVKEDQVLREDERVEIYRPLPRKPRDAHAVDDKKERIRARKESRTSEA